MTHAVRVDCCLTNNAYFVYWRSHSARNEPHCWRWFFNKNPNHFQVVAQPNSRTYDASGGQAASVLASIWFCKHVGQDHFAKFATTTSTNSHKLLKKITKGVWMKNRQLFSVPPNRYGAFGIIFFMIVSGVSSEFIRTSSAYRQYTISYWPFYFAISPLWSYAEIIVRCNQKQNLSRFIRYWRVR